MAIPLSFHPGSHSGYEFPREAGFRTTGRMPTPIDDSCARAQRCSVDTIARKIDSCEKARVLAIMALNLLAFDGQLHKDSPNWVCPFGHCKLIKNDPKSLIQHVLDCRHFSSNGVWCNCCGKDDSFEEHCRHNRAEEIAPHGVEKSSSKTRNPIRKLSNIFSRNRSEPRGHSPGSEGAVSPVSTHRRSSILSLMIPTPSPPSESRRGSPSSSQEPPREALKSALHAGLQTSLSELLGSEPHSVEGLHELPTPPAYELPDNPRVPEFQGPTFDDIMEMRGSPSQDLRMDSMIPDRGALPAYNASFSDHMEASHAELPPTNGFDSAFQPQHQHQHQPTWFMQQQQQQAPLLHPDSRALSAAAQERMYWADSSMSAFPPNPQFHHEGSPGWKPSESQVRKDSDDSGYSEGSNAMGQPGVNGAYIATSPSPAMSMLASPSAVAGLLGSDRRVRHCPYAGCNYRHTGNARKYNINLKKHIENVHERRNQVQCMGCGQWYTRPDNLKEHQRTACRALAAPHPVHRSSRSSATTQRGEWSDGWLPR